MSSKDSKYNQVCVNMYIYQDVIQSTSKQQKKDKTVKEFLELLFVQSKKTSILMPDIMPCQVMPYPSEAT